MKTLLTVIKAILEILASQQIQIKALTSEVDMDNQTDLTEADLAWLIEQVEALSVSETVDNEPMPF